MAFRHSIFYALLLSFALMGCAASQPEVQAPIVNPGIVDTELGELPETCLRTANRAIDLLREQKWSDFRKLYRSDLREHLSDEVLQQIWEQYFSPSGAYVETIASDVIVQKYDLSTEVITRFERNVLLTFFTFDVNGNMTSIQFPLYEDAASWGKCSHNCIFEAEQFSTALRNKEWTRLRQFLTDEFSQNVTDEQLESYHEAMFTPLGSLVSLLSRQGETQDGKTIVTHVTKYVKGTLVHTMTFDENGRIEAYRSKVIPNPEPIRTVPLISDPTQSNNPPVETKETP